MCVCMCVCMFFLPFLCLPAPPLPLPCPSPAPPTALPHAVFTQLSSNWACSMLTVSSVAPMLAALLYWRHSNRYIRTYDARGPQHLNIIMTHTHTHAINYLLLLIIAFCTAQDFMMIIVINIIIMNNSNYN